MTQSFGLEDITEMPKSDNFHSYQCARKFGLGGASKKTDSTCPVFSSQNTKKYTDLLNVEKKEVKPTEMRQRPITSREYPPRREPTAEEIEDAVNYLKSIYAEKELKQQASIWRKLRSFFRLNKNYSKMSESLTESVKFGRIPREIRIIIAIRKYNAARGIFQCKN